MNYIAQRIVGSYRFSVLPHETTFQLTAESLDGSPIGDTSPQELLQEQSLARGCLERAAIELTSHCNLRCCHCYWGAELGGTRQERATRQVLSFMDDLAGMGCLFLKFTGGEIFLRPDLDDILQGAVDRKFAVRLQTNGTLLDERRADFLSTLPLTGVEISLYGTDAETHERVTGSAGSFDASVRALQLLRNRRIPSTVHFIVMSENAHQVMAIQPWCEARRFPCAISPIVTPARDGSRDNRHRFAAGPEVAEAVRRSICSAGMSVARLCRMRQACAPGINSLCINPSGIVLPCEFIPIALHDLNHGGLAEGWKDTPWREFRQRARTVERSGCQGCKIRDYCFSCPASSYLWQGRLSAKAPALCALARRVAHVCQSANQLANNA